MDNFLLKILKPGIIIFRSM